MFIVVTDEIECPDEIELLHKMAAYPIVIHIRKPTFDKEQMQRWLQQFDRHQHQKMMLHQHHELIEHFDLKGIHLKEKHRKETDFVQKVWHYKYTGKMLSASFHSQSEAESQFLYDYVLLSPVFDSISKENYQGKSFQLQNPLVPIVALGGITLDTMKLAQDNGFAGIAILGSIWKKPQPFEEFKVLFAHYKEVYSYENRKNLM